MRYWLALAFVLEGILIVLVQDFFRHRRLKFYWLRGCSGRQWKTLFPEASSAEIREFLEIFRKAFDFSQKRRLSFRPDDKVLDIYRTVYPYPYPDFLADIEGFELAGFCMDIQDKYSIDLTSASPELTLGQIFAMTRKGKPS